MLDSNTSIPYSAAQLREAIAATSVRSELATISADMAVLGYLVACKSWDSIKLAHCAMA